MKKIGKVIGKVLIFLWVAQIILLTFNVFDGSMLLWYWVFFPLWVIVTIYVVVALIGFTTGIVIAIKNYHKSKLYRVSKLPKPIVDGFLRGYIENEFEEQLKLFPEDKIPRC